MENFIGIVEEGGELIIYVEVRDDLCWVEVMVFEYNLILENYIWDFVFFLFRIWLIFVCWIFKFKFGVDGGLVCFKVCIVVWGFEL